MKTKEQGLLVRSRADEAIGLLCELIAIPSISGNESGTADLIENFLRSKNLNVQRAKNNVWVKNRYYDETKPTILLNSHHDTVKPNAGYTIDPFKPVIRDGKLFGLGSNDAGASLVALLQAFLFFDEIDFLNYNLIFAATAEEEVSGVNGVESILNDFGTIEFGIVGEPTNMQLAIAEKGLMVLDCRASGIAGHAAREEGENAISKAVDDMIWFKNYRFPRISETLGSVKMSVTMVNSGSQHNVIPDRCDFVVDVRTTDAYTNEEVLSIILQNVESEVKPRSMRLKPSSISVHHPLVIAGKNRGLSLYGSPTLSDQALMNFPTLKIGPGDSARSHAPDEFVFIQEIENGIELYIELLKSIL